MAFSLPSPLVAEGGTGEGRLDGRANPPGPAGAESRAGDWRLPGPRERSPPRAQAPGPPRRPRPEQ